MSSLEKDELYTEASLSNTFVYKSFNRNAELSTILIAAIKDSIHINEKHIEDQLLTMKRIRISPIVDNVISTFMEGNIEILYSNVKKVPSFVPFFTIKSGSGYKSYIFLNNFGKLVEDKNELNHKYVDMPAKNLYALMEGAYLSYQYAIYPAKFVRNIGLMRTCMDTYVPMVTRILNKEYALSMDMESFNKVSYCIGRFFLESVWGITNGEQIFSYARQSRNINDQRATYLAIINDEYDNANIESVDQLINFIKTITPRLNNLTARYYYQRWIETYKYSTAFAMESLPYFLYIITCTQVGSFLINSPMIADISKDVKGFRNYYMELEKIV